MSELEAGIVLVGLPGSGKTEVGRCVAERLGRPFIDTDEEVAQATGLTPAEHFERDGEAAFREVEREAIARACEVEAAVIATGGGAVIDPLNRWSFVDHGLVAWLDVPVELALRRLSADPVPRPLLVEDAGARLEGLARERAPFYRSADVRVESTGAVEATADELIAAAGSRRLDGWRALFDAEVPRHHPIGPPTARVAFGRGIDRASLGAYLAPFEGRVPAVLIDRAVPADLPGVDGALPAGRRLEVVAGESIKQMAHLEEVLAWLAAEGVERNEPLIAVGGGTVGDLGGVAAALYMRGMPLVHVPTTWLAMADSAIGGKAAVDLPRAKNAVGAFWPAWATVADVEALRTLPEARLRDGIAECLKMGLVGDPELWSLVESRGMSAMLGEDEAAQYAILERAARLKLAICERDPFERGERRVLNLGHTLGHALEVESAYQLPHGDAVALGLRAVAGIAAERGADVDLIRRIDEVLDYLGFPQTRRFDPGRVKQALRTDKKREQGSQRWILPMALGRVQEVGNVTEAELDSAITRILANG